MYIIYDVAGFFVNNYVWNVFLMLSDRAKKRD